MGFFVGINHIPTGAGFRWPIHRRLPKFSWLIIIVTMIVTIIDGHHLNKIRPIKPKGRIVGYIDMILYSHDHHDLPMKYDEIGRFFFSIYTSNIAHVFFPSTPRWLWGTYGTGCQLDPGLCWASSSRGFGLRNCDWLGSNTVPIGSMVLLYMVTWIPSIYPSHVSIYTMWVHSYWTYKPT